MHDNQSLLLIRKKSIWLLFHQLLILLHLLFYLKRYFKIKWNLYVTLISTLQVCNLLTFQIYGIFFLPLLWLSTRQLLNFNMWCKFYRILTSKWWLHKQLGWNQPSELTKPYLIIISIFYHQVQCHSVHVIILPCPYIIANFHSPW